MTCKHWYQQSYRRKIDMHIADWDDKFLFEFDPKTRSTSSSKSPLSKSAIGKTLFRGLKNNLSGGDI
jgi:hypothetical protein